MTGRYRPDIDGLRTVAILPVVLFHAGVTGLSGGFVGVDVFFVISGFLITAVMAREVDEQRFSIVRFYERRIRRILPALAAVMVAVLAGAAWLYFPSDFRLVPRSVIAALLFCSNILFWSESSYFGASAHVKPMLHTWSLAVEEQFYIFFPLLLMFMRRFGPRWRTLVLLAIFVGSLLLSVVATRFKPDFAFYMLPTRAWELMAGALLAVGAVPAVTNRWAREAIALAGVAAIACAVLTFTGATHFPGAAALFPVLGAAVLIHAAEGTLVGRILSLRPIVFVGLISYSLYLWHWPVIVFAEYVSDAPLAGGRTLAAIVVSFALATLSWRFVERPFRSAAAVPRPRLFAQSALAAAAILFVCGGAIALRGWPQRFSAQVVALEAGAQAFSPRRKACHREQDDPLDRAPCVLGAAAAPTAMLWGDSHGVELSYALGEIAARHGRSLLEETTSSCPPLLGLAAVGRRCEARNGSVLSYLEAHPDVRTVFLAGYWADDVNRQRHGLPGALVATVERLRASGRHVVVVGAVPPQPWPVPRRLAHLAQRGELDRAAGITLAELASKTAYLSPALAQLRAAGVPVVEPRDLLCRSGRCEIYRDGQPLYFDRHHLSVAGARLVADKAASLVQ